ncbi:hypothetical protein [Metapseudomonas otitidis]|uniref:hypothetical protein n=1 Tax=Metapseudomonas otitidis TaxID=319939 RepID=UPI0024468DAD|nr:hypothetical protein [Pseudomonas otitidis]MDH0337617.1 hypothetical protein [Pseudomonas otitidis]
MSAEWNPLLPNLIEEYSHIALKDAEPTADEVERLQKLEDTCEENCQVLLDGLASLGVALANAAPELSAREIARIGFFVQYVAALAGDLAGFQSTIPDYLGRASGGRHEPV